MIRHPPRSPLSPYPTLSRPRQSDLNGTAGIPDLLRRLADDSKRLANDEVRLAKLELRESVRTSARRSEEHTSELQSRQYLVCRLLLEKKKKKTYTDNMTY